MKSKVLIITNEFIPYSKSLGGIIRILSLSNFLIINNYEVHILTTKSDYQSFFGYKEIYDKLKIHYINSHIQKKNSKYNFPKLIFRAIKKIIKTFFYNFYNSLILLGLDQSTLRLNKYKKDAYKILQNNSIENIIVSSPPFSLFLIAKFLKKKNNNFNIIHDYRDSWTLRFENNKDLLKTFSTKYIEKKSLMYVNYAVCASESIANKLHYKFKNTLINKPILVFNGYHINENLNFNNLQVSNNNKKIKIGYFGMINDDEKGYRDLKIIYNQIKNDEKIYNNFEFNFYGPHIIKNKDIKNFKIFKFYDSIDHIKALKKMAEMDYLLLIHSEESTASEVLTGKIFDYIYVKKPIIIISKGITEAGRLIKKFNIGYNIDINNTNLSETLLNLINIKKRYIKIPDNIYDSFSRDYQNKKYLKILNG